jgi:hypothetical protein
MGDTAEGHEVMRTDAMDGDAADHHHVRALVGEALAERPGRIYLIAAQQALLPEFAHALRRLAGVHGVAGDAAGMQQIGDGALEGGGIEGALARYADAAAVGGNVLVHG